MDLKTTNGNNNRNNIDHELGALERLESEIKNTIFGVLFVLLKEQEISIYTSFILAILQFIQVMAFSFHPTLSPIWSASDITDVVYKIIGFCNIVIYIKDTNWDLYITFFYIGVSITGLVLVGILFVSYTYARKKVSFSWPVIALRNILLLFTTLLFLPFLDYFISMLGCVDNGRGKIVHAYFSEIECWSGIHVLHAIFAIITSIIFVVISLIVSITYFEYRSASNDPNARVSSRPNFLLNFYKMVMILCLTFLTGHQFEIVLLAIILVGSAIVFVKFYFNSCYHDEIIAKLWSTLAAINLWTGVMLIFSRIMENTLFEGSVIAWMIGIPFVILIILTNRDHRIDLLLINVNKFQSGAEVQNQIRYILKLIQWQATNRNAAILLDGYIEIHKQSCNKDDCPLRQKVVKNNRFTKSLMNQDDTLNEKYALLIQLLYKMYFYGIKKFPNNTALRISYAFFLLEKMQSKQQALQELTQAEQNKPHFDEQFIIYRYKKIIEDEIAESQNEGQGGLDVVSEVAFQNHLRQLQANIEKSALLHMEFWSQLSEDNPDLAKLNDIGSKINSSVQYVEDNWMKLMKINSSNAKSMRLYGKFLIEIINDKETGDELLEKARNLTNVQSNKKAMNMVSTNNEDYNNEATPSVWVSGEQDKFGIITGINLAASSLFGYNKTELLNRKVNALMPQVFSKYHDSFLENYLNSGESSIIGKNKERLVFGKNKSNYVFPIYLTIKAVQSIIQGIQFIATFRVEKNFKNAAYILTTPDGAIDAVSASCINVLKIDLKAISQKKSNIQDYIPNIIKERANLFPNTSTTGKSTATIVYSYPKDSEYVMENEPTTVQLNCHVTDLVFLGGRENAGIQFKFERQYEKTQIGPNERKAKVSNFQFKFEKLRPIIIGEYVEGSTADLQYGPEDYNDDMLSALNRSAAENDQSGIEGSRMQISTAKGKQQEEEEEVKRVDYGVGIKTLRLFNGKPMEIDDDRSENDDEEGGESKDDSSVGNKNSGQYSQKQQQQNQQEEDAQEEGSYRDFNTTFKSRKALKTVINDRTPPNTIKNLKLITNALGVILFAIAIVDYVLSIEEFNSIQKSIDLLDLSNQRLAEMMNVLSKTRDLGLLNLGLLTTSNETTLRQALKTSLDTAKGLKEQLEQESSSLSDAHLRLLNNPMIELRGIDSSVTMKGLTQATEEVISKGFEIQSRPLVNITVTDADYYYVTYNLLNDYYSGLRSSSDYYTQELIDKVSDQNTSFLLLLIGSAAALVLFVIILLPILYQVNKAREEVLSLFLDIPEKTVKGLYSKCETFISNLQVGEEDDMLSDIDEEELEKNQDDHDVQEFLPRKKRKRFKNSGKSQRSFLIKFLGVSAVVEAYFLYNYISSSGLLDDINTIIVELNSTSAAEPFYSYANNAERQLFMDPSFPILKTSSETVATDNIKAMYDVDSAILQEHSINRKIHSDAYTDIFNQIMMVNPCSKLTGVVAQATCERFADLTVYQGMTVALTRHFENLRTLLSCYQRVKTGDNCTIDLPTNVSLPGFNATRNRMMSLLVTTQANEVDRMQHIYIRESFRILMREFKSSLNDEFSLALTRRLIIFIIFIVILAAVYVVIWLPLIRKISNDIWRTKSMLSMIPLNVIAKIRSIRLYLKRFWNERNLAEY